MLLLQGARCSHFPLTGFLLLKRLFASLHDGSLLATGGYESERDVCIAAKAVMGQGRATTTGTGNSMPELVYRSGGKPPIHSLNGCWW
jgi:hypothetical protein